MIPNTISIIVLYTIIPLVCSVLLFTKNSGTYTIRKGMNFSGIWLLKMFFMKQKPFQVRVKLTKSCEVKTLGVQKIFGMGDLFHHKNSDRYGFIYEDDNKFGIYSYQYRDGQLLPWKKLGSVDTNEDFYITFINTDRYTIGRYLFPYFEQDGDDERGAPHDMIIELDFVPLNPMVSAKLFEL